MHAKVSLVASLSTSCLRTACPSSTNLEPAVNNLYMYNNLVDIIRLVARLFQQVRYSPDMTILLQPCVVNLVTFLLYHDCTVRLVRTSCNKSDNAIKLVTSCQQLVPNMLQQLGTSSANTTCRQLVNRFVTTCLQTCNNLFADL